MIRETAVATIFLELLRRHCSESAIILKVTNKGAISMEYDYRKMIISLRNKLIMSQEEFAKYLGVSFASVNRWEKGHHEPTIKAKRKIVEECRKNEIELFFKTED